MTTRLYCEASGAPAVSPTFGSWTVTTNADRVLSSTSPLGTTAASKGESRTVSGTNTILERQFVTTGVALGSIFTIGAVLKAQFRCSETSGTNNVTARINARILSSDGLTLRATIRSGVAAASEFNTALRNITVSTTLSAGYVTLNASDIIVVEVGWVAGQSTTMTTLMNFGTNGASDLPEDETTTTALRPWVELADTITFDAAGATNWAPMLSDRWNRLVIPGE